MSVFVNLLATTFSVELHPSLVLHGRLFFPARPTVEPSMHPLEVSDTQTDKLREAAGYALCRNYHQNQADRVVREWKKILRGQVSWRRRDSESSEERAASRNHNRSASRGDPVMVRLLASPSTSSSTRSQEPHQRNSRHNGMNDRLNHTIDDDTQRMMTYHTETTHEAQIQAPSEGRTPGLQAVAVPESQPTRQQTCSATHNLRRSIDEDCVICTMLMVNCSLSELVWCKSSCGRSVHRDCFETMGGYVDVTRCVFW